VNATEPELLYPLGKAPAPTGLISRSAQAAANLSRRLKSLLRAPTALPPPLASVDNYSLVGDWPMYDRGKALDCTCAAAGHMIMAWTTLAQGACYRPSVESILAVYDNVKDRSSADPNTTCAMVTVLRWWRDKGIAEHRIQDYTHLLRGEKDSVRNSINLLGCCYIGLQLPAFLFLPGVDALQSPWTVPSSGTSEPNTRTNPKYGHAVAAVGYDDQNITFVTWGHIKTMTWTFYAAYSDEAYAVLSPDWFTNAGSPRYGLQLAALAGELERIG
jgi:hypothetical protein